MKSKFFALVLVLMLFITACSGEAPRLLDFIGDDSGAVIDFEGMTFRFFHDSDEDLRYVDDGSAAASARHEKLMKRLDDIEKNYSCTIVTSAGEPEDFSLNYVSGIPCADLFNSTLKYAYPMFLANYFIPVNYVPNIDLYSGKYGSEALIDTLTWNGKTYGFYPEQWGQGPLRFSNSIVFNPELFKTINHPTPNEYYEQGLWNWDTLLKVGKDCVSISTEDRPVYLSTANAYFFRMLLLSNGGEYIRQNENGKYESGLLDPRVIDALQFGNDIYEEGLLEESSGGYETYVEKFSKNMYAILCEYADYGVDELISADSGNDSWGMNSVGYCYAPAGPSAVDNTRGSISTYTYFYHVTREKEDNSEVLGHFMELVFAPLDEDANAWKDEFTTMYFFDEMSAEVYMTQATNASYDRVMFAYTSNLLFDTIVDAAKNGNIMEKLQSIESMTNANLDEGINAGIK